MDKSIQQALTGLGRDYLDIFYLHAPDVTPAVFEERAGAFQCLLDYKDKCIIRAAGISTHVVEVIKKAAAIDQIDVVFPIINKKGLGIIGGSTDDMIEAIENASENGKGVVAMKVLAGGNLINDIKSAFSFVRNIKGITSVAVGMSNKEEVDVNIRLFNDVEVSEEELSKLRSGKDLFVSRICTGCGNCVKACPNEALVVLEDKVVVQKQKCILCGYCNPVCPQFALRLL